MGRMVRKQIYIKPAQSENLKCRAKELGVSEARLIRQYIDEGTIRDESERERLKAWEEIKQTIKQRMAMKVPQTGRDWTRDELYEERFERYSH